MGGLVAIFNFLGLICVIFGLISLLYLPLALFFEWRRPKGSFTCTPLVSIVIPAYNEERVIVHCLDSIVGSHYPKLEIIVVDDGSTDNTLSVLREHQARWQEAGADKEYFQLKICSQGNKGKAAALNRGIAKSKGEFIFLVDADGVFTPHAIGHMLRGFTKKCVGAVCGNDRPVNIHNLQTRWLNLQTHVTTALARRALAFVGCLPIVSGNIGAFRRSTLRRVGPLVENILGEDLELTWRVQRAGYDVNFVPEALVLAEVPKDLSGLWQQRVRWARGFLQTTKIHRDMFFKGKYGPFAFYLPFNVFCMVVLPLVQLGILALLPVMYHLGFQPIPTSLFPLLCWLGLIFAFLISIVAIALDKAWGELKDLYVIPLWAFYSLFLNIVMLWSIILELRRTPASWNKLERTGIISRGKERCEHGGD